MESATATGTSARLFGTQAAETSGAVVSSSSVVMSMPSGVDASRIGGTNSSDGTGALFEGSASSLRSGGIGGVLMAVRESGVLGSRGVLELAGRGVSWRRREM